MQAESTNRQRISTSFTFQIAFIILFITFTAMAVINSLLHKIFNSETALLLFVTIVLIFIVRYLKNRNKIEYDDILRVIYIVDTKLDQETVIPVKQIDKILFSSFGFGIPRHSYVIRYRDAQNQSKKFRLFPIPFDNSIDRITTDAKLENPALITRNWSFGFNEFFD